MHGHQITQNTIGYLILVFGFKNKKTRIKRYGFLFHNKIALLTFFFLFKIEFIL